MSAMSTSLRAIGYVRVSTNKQEIGPEVQIATLTEEAARRGWTLELRREDAASAKSLSGRPVLAGALADLKAGHADVLAVAKLDRLSRSVADFARILEDAERQRWHVVCVDLGVDTTTITGRAMAHVTATFAEMERRRIAERTREGMARIKAAHPDRHMGRPVTLSATAEARIHELRAAGASHRAIADTLTAEGVPTGRGGQWWPATVGKVLKRSTVRY